VLMIGPHHGMRVGGGRPGKVRRDRRGACSVPKTSGFVGPRILSAMGDAMRAMWKGTIELQGREIPVKLYAAVEDSAVHFHLLHARDERRVELRIVDPTSGETVPPDTIRRGYPLHPSEFVILNEQELEGLEPAPSRRITVESALPAGAIPPAYFDRPYFLGPDDGDSETYFALAEALRRRGRQCLVRFVMRGHLYRASIRSNGDYLSLITLRTRDQVLAAPAVESTPRREATKRELALAELLVATLQDDFDPALLRSQYRDRVRELVQSRAQGKPTTLRRLPERKASATSLESALKASLARATPAAQKERKSA
jgi:DNA end-binding protein Ku